VARTVVFAARVPDHAHAEWVEEQRDYLLTLAGYVKELAEGRCELSAEQKIELERQMSAYLPGAGLSFLISMNADPIARELNGG
jgi:hypothetical protein